jgi:glycosyltransferase involved in cell wall biosynthesis
MTCPGGLDHSGGIGRWAGYVIGAWPEDAAAPAPIVIDTRGYGGVMVGLTAFPRALMRLLGLALSGRLGIIHANLCVNASTLRVFVIATLFRSFGARLVVHLHSGNYSDFYSRLPRIAQDAVKGIFRKAARVIVPGKVWEDMLVREIGVERSKIGVLYNAVPEPDLSARRKMADGRCHIVMLARLEPAKGVPELLDALADPAIRALPWRATLAGDGEDAYRRRAAELGIGDRIAFPGWVGPDVVDRLLLEADILVLPSHFECLPVSLVEAMAHGVAVVTTPVGAVPEVVTDGESALLVPVRDKAALAAALGRLIQSPDLRDKIGAAGRVAYEGRLEASRSARLLSELYAELAS